MTKTSSEHTVLLIDGDVNHATNASRILTNDSFDVTVMHKAATAIEYCKHTQFDIIIIDERLRDKTGLDTMQMIRKLIPDAKIFLSSFSPVIRLVVRAIKSGADHFLQKPYTLPDIRAALAELPEHHLQSSETNKKIIEEANWETGSSVMQTILDELSLVVASDYSVNIYGPSGSGKDMVARLTHQQSKRKEAPFIAIDCGTLTEELAASTFFGHLKGAFTGAVDDRIGCFEQADGGTLFLDEIGNLPPKIQTYLLRAIQEKKFRRIGGNKEQDFDVRLIVASNRDLMTASEEGTFREDLFHRLNEFTINLPSLYDRQEDILPLAHHFLALAAAELGKTSMHFSGDVKDLFIKYGWPGNLRELRNVIRRCCLLEKGSMIEINCLPHEIWHSEKSTLSSDHAIDQLVQIPISSNPNDLKEIVTLEEKRLIMDVLARCKNNKNKAAITLNIDRKTLYNKLRLYNLDAAGNAVS